MQVVSSGRKKTNYVFVDTVRFWSMFAVIGFHCLSLFGVLKHPMVQTSMVIATLLKFGTIGFFLISGFLLGDRVQTCRPMEYLGKRMKKVFVPWICWFSAMSFYLLAHHRNEIGFNRAGSHMLGRNLYLCLFDTPYWFVPNLLLGLCVLLIFRKYLYDARLGAILLAIDLFYAVNIYAHWVPSSHQEALLGFVFYLWLGSYASRRFDVLGGWLGRVSLWTLGGLTVMAAVCALGEAEWLIHLGAQGPLNTLRVTNQAFSVLAVLTMMKLGKSAQPRFIDSRRVTFGLYLTHPLMIELVLRVTQGGLRRVPASTVWMRPVGLVALWGLVFAAVYGLSLGLTTLVAGWPATGWLVGAETAKAKPVRETEAESQPYTDAAMPGLEA